MAINVKLMKRLKRPNVKGRKAYYYPRAVTANKRLEPGTYVSCLDDAKGESPRLVEVSRVKDLDARRYNSTAPVPDKFTILLEDLAE